MGLPREDNASRTSVLGSNLVISEFLNELRPSYHMKFSFSPFLFHKKLVAAARF